MRPTSLNASSGLSMATHATALVTAAPPMGRRAVGFRQFTGSSNLPVAEEIYPVNVVVQYLLVVVVDSSSVADVVAAGGNALAIGLLFLMSFPEKVAAPKNLHQAQITYDYLHWPYFDAS